MAVTYTFFNASLMLVICNTVVLAIGVGLWTRNLYCTCHLQFVDLDDRSRLTIHRLRCVCKIHCFGVFVFVILELSAKFDITVYQ